MLLPQTLFVSLYMLCANADVYTSVEELTQLFSLEKQIAGALSQYVDKTEQRLSRIKRYLQEYEQGHSSASEANLLGGDELESLAGNPLQAFHLVKRLSIDWKQLQRPHEDWQGVEDVINKANREPFLNLPAEEDLQGAAKALLRLQSVYQLNTSNLVRGNVLGIPTSTGLRAQDCLYMGKHSFNLGLYLKAVEWFEEAYSLAVAERNATITPTQVMEFVSVAMKAHQDSLQADTIAKQNAIHRLQINGFNPLSLVGEGFASGVKNYTLGDVDDTWHDIKNYEALCRGEKLLKEEYLSTLKCFLSTRNSSYYLLMPIKVEKSFHDPEILVFHDVISDAEIRELKDIAKPYLSRGMVQGAEGYTVSNVRTSKVAWINDFDHPLVEKLNSRIGEITGLSTSLHPEKEDAEIMQIANYGTGGHYSSHFDFLFALKNPEEIKAISPREIELGDRVSTFMFYLSDVVRGGATVFPKLGVALWPRKGSAAFWHNLKRSGEGDKRTLHGGCPVVYGSKWVSNKWIRERGQFDRRPCAAMPDM